MAHPLYPVARRLVGRPIVAHHINGRAYPGILHSVQSHGIYMYHTSLASFDEGDKDVMALGDLESSENTEEIYAPFGYFAFGALTGLTLGALARPYGYYW